MSIKSATFIGINYSNEMVNSDFKNSAAVLENAAPALAHRECLPSQSMSFGLVPHPTGKYVEVTEFALRNGSNTLGGKKIGFIQIKLDRKILPAEVITQEVNKRCEELRKQTGELVRSKDKSALRVDITAALLTKAFVKSKIIGAAIIFDENKLVVFSAIPAEVLMVTRLIHSAYGENIKYTPAPILEFLPWQIGILGEADTGLAISRKIKLRQKGTPAKALAMEVNGGVVSEDELRKYFQEGYFISGIHLSDEDDEQFSFYLTNGLEFKSIKFARDWELGLLNVEEEDVDPRINIYFQVYTLNLVYNKLLKMIEAFIPKREADGE